MGAITGGGRGGKGCKCAGLIFYTFFSHIFLHDKTSQVVVMLRKGGKAATTKGITVSADSMLGEQV